MQEGNSVLNKIKIFIRDIKGIIFTVAILGTIIVLFGSAVNGASEKADTTAMETVEKAIKRAAVQCYAIEGFYPADVEYLTDNYGVIIDREKFIVDYSAETPNYMPIIQVKRFGVAE